MEALTQKARDLLLNNFNATGKRYICPSWPHYPWQWGWDSCFHAISAAHLGMHDLAKNEIRRLLRMQVREGFRKGFISHQIYWKKIIGINKRGLLDVERLFYRGWMRPTSPLSAQPVLAQAVRAIGDRDFFLENTESIVDFYKYFENLRDPDGDGLISIITPRESGRDSSPEFDFFRLGGVRFGKPFKFLDVAVDILSLFWLEFRYKLMGWDERKVLRSHIFDVQDLVIQCIYIDGLYDLMWMMENWGGSLDRYPGIREVISRAENAVLEKCWNEEDQTFYSLRNGSEQLKDLTIASLFPILIKNLPEERVKAIVAALEDETRFNTSYPVPSVSVLHPEFNPSRTIPIWRGPTWINTNWFLIRGLVRNGHTDIARRISDRSIEMVDNYGFNEFYNPFTGEGLRIKNFGWSTLVVTFRSMIDKANH